MLIWFLITLLFIALLLILSGSVVIGRWFGNYQLKHNYEHKLEIVGVAEKSVFALLALLIAFSFSGAYERYESRKLHILQEANAYSTAYNYIDLLPSKVRDQLQNDTKEFLSHHILAYEHIPHMDQVYKDLELARQTQHRIWETLIASAKADDTLMEIIIPAVNDMFVLANSGINISKIHPPIIIFVLLVGLAAMGAFLIGYNSAQNTQRRPIHILSYVLLISSTIFVVVNLEYPRTGFIRLNYFDQVLIDVRDNMKT